LNPVTCYLRQIIAVTYYENCKHVCFIK
jgi:hypothetical protein